MNRLQSTAIDVLARDCGPRAIEFEGRWRTWAEVRHVAGEVGRLVEASGADPQAPVYFIARNRPGAMAALLGLVAAGRTIRTLYGMSTSDATARDVLRLKTAVVVGTDEDMTPEVLNAVRQVGGAAIVIKGMEVAAAPGLAHSTTEIDPQTASPEQTVQILTSGTTGAPKHFPIGIPALLRICIDKSNAYPASVDVQTLPPALLYASVANITGMFTALPALLHGHPILLKDRFDLKAWVDYVKTYQLSFFVAPPPSVQMILDTEVPAEDLESLKWVMVGSAPLDVRAQKAFDEKYGAKIILAYGATEFLGLATSMTPELFMEFGEAKLGSVGRPIPDAKVRVANLDTDEALPPGEAGVVEVYLPLLYSDWVRTSDLGVIDEDGFLFLRGRADGAINRGGYKVLPATIEAGLMANPAVAEACVIAVPDHRLGQVPAAAIELRPGIAAPSIDDLKAHLRGQVSATHIPVHRRIMDALPRTETMKVHRKAVAALFEEMQPA